MGLRGYVDAVKPEEADVVARGRAASGPLEDERLSDLNAFKASLEIDLSTPVARSLTQEASAVDLSTQSASAKALENAKRFSTARMISEYVALYRSLAAAA